jgi:DegV family protein with EDD domain
MGLGLLAVIAARAANDGATLKEIAKLIDSAIPRIRIFFTVDTLEYLRKGGRIGAAQWLLGSLLKIKPILEVIDGHVEGIAKTRSHIKAVDKIRTMTESLGAIEEMAVVYNTALPEAKSLGQSVSRLIPRGEKIFYSAFGPVIGTYTGPGAIGIVSLLKNSAV